MLVDVKPGTFGDVFEDELRAEHGVTCGHWPQSMALSTVGGWLACRGAGQLSTRYGKIEDIVAASTSCSPTARSITTGGTPRAAVGPDLTQLFVGSEGTLGIIIGARLRLHPLPPAEIRAAFAFTRSPTGSTRCAASCNAARRPRCCASTTRSRPTAATRPATRTSCSRSTRATRTSSTRPAASSTRSARRPTRSTSGSSSAGWSTATTCRRSKRSSAAASSSTRWRSRRRGARCPTSTSARPPRSRRVEHTMVASAHQSHSYTDGACLYFTFAGKPPAADREAYYRAAWDAGQRAVLAAGGALSHHHGIGLNRSRFVARGARRRVRRAAVGEGRARPERHPQPRQARAREPVRRGRLAVSNADRVLVVDVGTSSVRAAVVRADGSFAAGHERELLPDSPADGLVEFDAALLARHVPRARARRARPPTGRSTRSASPTSAARRSCGTARPATPVGPGLGWQDLRTIGACLTLRAEGVRVGPNQSATKVQWLLDQLDDRGARRRPLLRHRRHLGRVDALRRRAARDRRDQRRRHRPAEPRRVGLGRDGARQARRPGRDDAGDRRLRRASPARRSALPGAPPITALVGDQQASLVGQGCVRRGDAKITFGTGGMLDVVLDETPPRLAQRNEHGTFPIVAWRHGGRCTWGVEAVMLAAGTNVQWLRDDLGIIASSDESHDARRVVRRQRRRRVRARAARARARRRGTTARAARSSASRAAPGAPRSRARCSKASRTAAPISSTPPRPTAGSRIPHVRVDGGMTDNPTFVQALADATPAPGRDLTGARGHRPGRRAARRASRSVITRRSTSSPPRGSRARPSSPRGSSTAIAGATRSSGRAAGSPSSRGSTSSRRRPSVASSERPPRSAAAARSSANARAACIPSTAATPPTSAAGRLRRGTPGLNAITRPSTASATAHALDPLRVLRALLHRRDGPDAEHDLARAEHARHHPRRSASTRSGRTGRAA